MFWKSIPDPFVQSLTLIHPLVLSNPSPISGFVYVETNVEQQTITLAAFHTSGIYCQQQIPGTVVESGARLLPVRPWLSLLKNLPDVPVEFQLKDTRLSLTVSDEKSQSTIGSYLLETLSTDEFTHFFVNNQPEDLSITVPATDLKHALAATVPIIVKPNPSGNPVTNCINLAFKTGCLELNATDSYRLQVVSLFTQNNTEHNAVLSAKSINHLFFLLAKTNPHSVTIALRNNQVTFTADNWKMIATQADVKYPNIHKLFPTNTLINLILSYPALLTSLKRFNAITKNDKIIFIEIKKEKIILKNKGNDNSIQGEEWLPTLSEQSQELTIAVNAQYLLKILEISNPEKTSEIVEIGITTPTTPILVRHTTRNPIVSLIMPVLTHTAQT